MSAASLKIAQTILEGFKTHYRLFQSSTNEALELFTEKKWKDLQNLLLHQCAFELHFLYALLHLSQNRQLNRLF